MNQPARPANMTNIIEINQGKRALSSQTPSAPAISVSETLQRMNEQAIVLDIRNMDAFAAGHVPGALFVPLQNPNFEQWVGWIIPGDASMILIADEEGDIANALHKLAFLGLDSRVVGYLDGGMNGWIRAAQPRRLLTQMSASYLHHLLAAQHSSHNDIFEVLDVREALAHFCAKVL
ncbi:rhodanese-like domain-containing protein [Chloroflexi bacterium TSY]|nr:rhodanese-like domain-containing protein [Chloroflexi bacterium TSY]